MYDGTEPPKLPTRTTAHKTPEWGDVGKDARFLNKLCRFLAEMNDGDRQLLLSFAENVGKRRRGTRNQDPLQGHRQIRHWPETAFNRDIFYLPVASTRDTRKSLLASKVAGPPKSSHGCLAGLEMDSCRTEPPTDKNATVRTIIKPRKKCNLRR